MKYTEKLGLKKPDLTDYVNINDLNENMDLLDEAFIDLEEQTEQAETNAKDYTDEEISKIPQPDLSDYAKKQDLVPSGAIIMWSGSISNIPSGWQLCNGQNGTPNLQNRFIVGAGGSYSVGATGGAESVALTTAQMPSHTHGSGSLVTNTTGDHDHNLYMAESRGSHINGDRRDFAYNSIGTKTTTSGSHSHTINGSTSSSGSGQAHENRPPYYALAYIMKL